MESLKFINGGYGKVDPSSEDQLSTQNLKSTDKGNRNLAARLTFVVISGLLICALVVLLIQELTAKSSHDSQDPSPLSFNSSELLTTVCAVTQHPDSCFSTIYSINGPTKPDPVYFFNLSLQVDLQELNNISSLPKTLILKSTDKGSVSALTDCITLFDDAVSQLSQCVEEMKVGPNEKVLTEMKISNMKTWISAAMTDQVTCIDGLEEMESSFLDEVKVKVQKSRDYMSNSLAILNNIEKLLLKFGLKMP